MRFATYATTDQLQDSLGRYQIPDHWWSRKFEYPWAAQFAAAGDGVADIACGVEHFFKDWLADLCEFVWAIDQDEKLLTDCPDHDNMRKVQANLAGGVPAPDGLFDRLFFISVFEHLPMHLRRFLLEEFHRVLRPGGQAVVTFDIPDMSVSTWREIVRDSPLEFHRAVSDSDFQEPPNILVSPRKFRGNYLKVFCSVLCKD